jgi:FkbM family methyltransferase
MKLLTQKILGIKKKHITVSFSVLAIVLLALAIIKVNRIDNENYQIPWVESAENISSNINEIPQRLLVPFLLDDSEKMAHYLAAFPKKNYEIKTVPGVGKFYLDDRQDLIKNTLREGKVWEKYIVETLQKNIRPDSTVIDAGAHIGTHTLMMSKYAGLNGRIYAFEPQRKLFRELYYNLELNSVNNVIPLRFALGDRNAVIEMYPAAEGNEGGTAVGTGGDKAELRTIDSFHFQNVSVIKIDVEGLEDAVINGARNTITSQKPHLIVEIQGGHNFDFADPVIRNKIVKTIRLLESMGYYVVRISAHDYLGVHMSELVEPDKS